MKPTLKNIAAMSNTSIATVSRLINGTGYVSDELKKTIEVSMRTLGYKKKCSTLNYNVVNKIHVIANDDMLNPSSFYASIYTGLKFEVKNLDIDMEVLLINTLPTDIDALKIVLKDVKAVILVGMENPDIVNNLIKLNIPTQIINGCDQNLDISSISPDYEYGGFLAGQHLISKGHKNLAIITVNMRQSLIERQLGFQRACSKYNLINDNLKIIDLLQYAYKHAPNLYKEISIGNAGGDFGAKILLPKIIKEGLLDDIDGVFCVCDMIAISLLQTLKSQNKPWCSIIGFDDLPYSSFINPPLTTIRSNYYELAKQGLAMLLSKINMKAISSVRSYMAVELIERESVVNKNN